MDVLWLAYRLLEIIILGNIFYLHGKFEANTCLCTTVCNVRLAYGVHSYSIEVQAFHVLNPSPTPPVSLLFRITGALSVISGCGSSSVFL